MGESLIKDLSPLTGKWKSVKRGLGGDESTPVLFPEALHSSVITPGPGFLYVFDYQLEKFTYVCPNFEWILGYKEKVLRSEGREFLKEIIHPEDLPKVLLACSDGWNFMSKQSAGLRTKLTMGVCFRMRASDDQYFHFLHQIKPLGYDCYGNILSIMGVFTNMKQWQYTNEIRLSVDGPKIHFSKAYEQDKIPMDDQIRFSKRELEILKLISQGYRSKEIAGMLFISIHTVNSHRRNMLGKIDGRSTAELINYAVKHGSL